jgi:hypothetical protein
MSHREPDAGDQRTGAGEVRVVVSVDPGRFAGIAQALREVVLVVEDEQPEIGTIAGTVTEERLAALDDVDGVDAVEREREHRVRPERQSGSPPSPPL